MEFFNVLVLLSVLFFQAACVEDVGDLSDGDNEIKVSQLPVAVKLDLISIATGGPLNFGSCLGNPPDLRNFEVLLYNSSTKENPQILDLNNPTGINPAKRIFLVTHGWLSGKNGYLIKDYRNAFVDKYGENVIFLNWGKLAWYPYTTVYCNLPFMAQYIADFLCAFSENNKMPLSNVHVIGHSFGGQFSGLIGKGTQSTCGKKIGKITALDPAGPIYQFLSASKRLAPTDAEFVEVVHSAAGTFGYMGKCGTVDYHLNCGSLQPGCIIPKDIASIPETSIYMLCCPHMRPVKLWPFVLKSKKFTGKSCTACPSVIPGTCVTDSFRPHFVAMGHSSSEPRNQHYNVVTSPYDPYHMGCSPYPLQGCA